MESHEDIARILMRYRSFLIATHVFPDGDAIGSALGLGFGLQKTGRKAVISCPGGVPETLSFLPGSNRVVAPDRVFGEFEAAVVLDSSDLDRIEGISDKISSGVPVINIDHHVTNKVFGTYNYVDPGAAAVGEQIYRILTAMRVPVDRDMATCLFTAVSTDSGFFRFSNTSPTTLRIAARLVEKGAEPFKISEQVYETKTLGSLRLLGRVLDTLRVDEAGKVAWVEIKREWLSEFGVDEGQTEGFVNYPRMVRGVEVALLFRESTEGKIRVGMRSRGDFDVSVLAEVFNGGGHSRAAGCSIEAVSLEDARLAVLGKVYELMAAR
ncbi:MAG: bifunctional oligoribonuclease/PAP phosphatase NrnA [Firmicutes bacterium]|nr:bifunctional oligoribonuclease/PAP phosphatase NrnA [Bacillota bacterium]MDH7495508.1 bifunctional oligoribonuclease/PAP phosphatase NrnA [Bacillota bacterium]